MIILDKKKAVTAILGKMSESGEKPSQTEGAENSIPTQDDMGLHTISEDAIQAFHSKNAGDLTQALKAFWAEMSNRSKGD